MKSLLVLVLFFSVSFIHAQPWNFLGSNLGIADASEVDIEITPNGQLFMAYIDTQNGNKAYVRKWMNNAWVLIGTSAGISSTNVFDIQLVMCGEDIPAIAVKHVTLISTTNYEFLEIYKWNGTTWAAQGIGTYIWTFHSMDYSLRANTSGALFLTYFNREFQTFSEGIITINMSTATQLGPIVNQGQEGNAMSSYVGAGNNFIVAHEENDIGDYLPFDVFNGTSYTNYSLSGVDGSTKMKLEKGINTLNTCAVWKNTDATNQLKFKSFNGSTFGSEAVLHSSNLLADFDFDTQDNNAFVFYRNNTTSFFKKVTNTTTPVVTTISSGSSFAPTTCTSMAAETYYGVHVVAYVDGGKCYVKEYNQRANIEDTDLLSMCEGTTFNNSNDPVIFCLDPNYSQANLAMSCVSQNTSIIPQSSITVFGAGSLQYRMNISTTNDVTSPTIVDLKWVLFEQGIAIDSVFTPIVVNPKPTITFNFPSSSICENNNPVPLGNKASPPDGIWSGPGVVNNVFYPANVPVGTTTITYSKTNQFGCSSSSTFTFTILENPSLTVSTTDAECNQSNGSASVNITNGQLPYAIYWSSGSTQTSVSNLAPGQYFLTVSDNNNCSTSQPVLIGSNGLSQSGVVSQISCNGLSDGAIDVSVIGGTAPLVYAWSNGSTTQDLSTISGGPYELTIEDALGCISTASYTVNEPQSINITTEPTITIPTCGTNDGAISVDYSGGNQPYTYAWFDDTGTNLNTNSNSLSSIAAGVYTHVVTDINGCQISSDILVSNSDGPVIAIDTVIHSSCSNDGSISITNISGNALGFTWSNGAVTQNISNLAPGYYTVEATGGNGCISTLGVTVEPVLPLTVDICLVTVDTMTNTNLVVWEKPITNGIDHFNVYRETSFAGLYQIIGTVPYVSESIFNDTVASPSVRSWRYKLSSVDNCGTESEISSNHKTIHLVINEGIGTDINLSWDSYEGFNYPEFVIKRYTDADGWNDIALMPTNLFTYTDNPPTTNGLTYLVTIAPPAICSATKAQDFNTVRSNKDKGSSLLVNSLEDLIGVQTEIYPSPNQGVFIINNQTGSELKTRVFDAEGRVVKTLFVTTGKQQLNWSDLNNGVYQIELSSRGIKTLKKLVIAH